MLVTIGILIIVLLIIIIFYQNLVSEKVKVEDAEEHLKQYLKEVYKVDEKNIEEQIVAWQASGMKLDKKGKYLFDYLEYRQQQYQAKLKRFPYSVMKEIFK